MARWRISASKISKRDLPAALAQCRAVSASRIKSSAAFVAIGAAGDPNAGGDEYFVPIQQEWRAHFRPIRSATATASPAWPDLIQQHGKFVACQARHAAVFLQPRDGIGGAQAVAKPRGQGLQ